MKIAALLLPLLLLPGAPGPSIDEPGRSPRPSVEVEREAWVMGTRLRIRVAAPTREDGLRLTEVALSEVEGVEALLSTWRDDTPLARLNRAPVGEPVPLPGAVGAVLEEAREWARATGGAFEPTLGALVDAWGLRTGGRRPGPGELRRALEATGEDAIELRPADGTAVRRHPAASIDAGAFGKGAGLRAATRELAARGVRNAVLDLGGQLAVIGPGEEPPRSVRVAHPHHRNRPVATLGIRDASVATSGVSERGVVVNGERLGHLLDPRDGRPVPAWGSVTVAAADPLVADALSTALFVMGPGEGMAWARGRTDVAVLFLVRGADGEDGLNARWNGPMEGLLTELAPEVRRPRRRSEQTMTKTHERKAERK